MRPREMQTESQDHFKKNMTATRKTRLKHEKRERKGKEIKNQNRGYCLFYLHNVITFPRAIISSFFSITKINILNLTVHSSLDKKAYNALWVECIAGRRVGVEMKYQVLFKSSFVLF